MPKYLVLDSDNLLPRSIPVCEYSEADREEAIEHAANRKGYVVKEHYDGGQQVIWVSPKFDAALMLETIVRRWSDNTATDLAQRRDDIMRHVRDHRMSEAA